MAQDHIPVKLSDEQRANLGKLAAYLRTLPEDYPDFEMATFVNDENGGDPEAEAYVPICGTAACAAGHGPIAGILPNCGETWWEYSNRAFADGEAWSWCFAGAWSDIDNTVHGAAARIDYMLSHGLPADRYDQQRGRNPLSYTAQVTA